MANIPPLKMEMGRILTYQNPESQISKPPVACSTDNSKPVFTQSKEDPIDKELTVGIPQVGPSTMDNTLVNIVMGRHHQDLVSGNCALLAKPVSTQSEEDPMDKELTVQAPQVGATIMTKIPVRIDMVRLYQKAVFANCVIQVAAQRHTQLENDLAVWWSSFEPPQHHWPKDTALVVIIEAHYFDMDDMVYILTNTRIRQYLKLDIDWLSKITECFMQEWDRRADPEASDTTRARIMQNGRSFISRYVIITHFFIVKISCTRFFDEKNLLINVDNPF